MNKFLISILSLFFSVIALQMIAGGSNDVESVFQKAGLIDINAIDSSIQVNLVNSNPENNFFRKDYYQGLNKAYLRKNVALKLAKAQSILKSKNSDYSLLILDAARPRSASQKMYDKMKGTKFERYVANPKKGSMHNYGIAVDISIATNDGKQIDMGFTPFFKSDIQIYLQFIKMKIGFDLSKEQKKNRKLLLDVMKEAGFQPLSFEWWHFNGMVKSEVRKIFKIIE